MTGPRPHQFDDDANGLIDEEELVKAMRELCVREPPREVLTSLFNLLDEDGDGVLE
jgi:Ca2+-binding EF-hand superfamily protein